MRLNAIQTLIILLAITVGTVITRFLPPILFPHGKPLPKFLQELCTLLPPAMMGLLLVYSLRNVSFKPGNSGIAAHSLFSSSLSLLDLGGMPDGPEKRKRGK